MPGSFPSACPNRTPRKWLGLWPPWRPAKGGPSHRASRVLRRAYSAEVAFGYEGWKRLRYDAFVRRSGTSSPAKAEARADGLPVFPGISGRGSQRDIADEIWRSTQEYLGQNHLPSACRICAIQDDLSDAAPASIQEATQPGGRGRARITTKSGMRQTWSFSGLRSKSGVGSRSASTTNPAEASAPIYQESGRW